MNDDIKNNLRRYLNPVIKGNFTNALLEALAEGDRINKQNILAVKDQLFIATASGTFLEKLMAGIGVTKPTGVGISDDLFRTLGIQQTNSKLVTNIFLDVLETFYGSESIRANVLSGKPEGYVLQDGMTLIIGVDNNDTPLTITFSASDFTSIINASALEVSNAISRIAFNSGYTLTASTFLNPIDGQTYIQLLSGTKGARSSITILGGSAQNIFQFPLNRATTQSIGTQFSTSFSGSYVKFTWTSGPNPSLGFVDIGDYVNIYGSGYLPQNQGTFIISNIQDGPIGQAFFEIINPNFVVQGPVTLSGIGGASGNGKVTVSSNISAIPSGTVRSSNIVTVTTTSPHGFVTGQTVTIQGVDNTAFDGTFVITATPLSTTFQYFQIGIDASSGNGLASVSYSIYSSPIGATRSGGVSTITTTTNHNLTIGQLVTITGVDDSSFDGIFFITGTTSNEFTYNQDISNDITFFSPEKQTIQKLSRYASVYEVNPYEIVIFLPATAKIVKRFIIGGWHLHNSALDRNFLGSYVFNPKEGFSVTKIGTSLTSPINVGSINTVLFGTNTSSFPDQEGFLVFDFGNDNQEGPVKYLGRPSSGSLLLDPSYKFQKSHDVGADVRIIQDRKPYTPKSDGSDYQAYITGTIQGRIEAENLINTLKASGISITVIIVYPEGPGLSDVPGYVYAGDFT